MILHIISFLSQQKKVSAEEIIAEPLAYQSPDISERKLYLESDEERDEETPEPPSSKILEQFKNAQSEMVPIKDDLDVSTPPPTPPPKPKVDGKSTPPNDKKPLKKAKPPKRPVEKLISRPKPVEK